MKVGFAFFLKLQLLMWFNIFSISSFDLRANTTDSELPATIKVDIFIKGQQPAESFNSIVIPLKQVGRLFLIEAKVDQEEGNLIFDTGATEFVLNRTYFRKYASYEKQGAGGITGNFSKVYGTVVKQLDASGFFYEKVEADMADLGHIEDQRGVKILGLFGLKMIDDLEIIFDAAHQQLILFKLDSKGERIDNQNFIEEFSFEQTLDKKAGIATIKGRIGERNLNFCLDTGAEINAINKSVPKNVMDFIQISRRSAVRGSASGKSEALYGIINSFEFGNQDFGSMGTVIIDLTAMSDSYGCHIDGMLGYDFWIKGKYCLNFRKNKISFNLLKEAVL